MDGKRRDGRGEAWEEGGGSIETGRGARGRILKSWGEERNIIGKASAEREGQRPH